MKLLRKHDRFGQPVKLSFNKKGRPHTTIGGGIATVLLGIYLIHFFITHAIIVVTYGE